MDILCMCGHGRCDASECLGRAAKRECQWDYGLLRFVVGDRQARPDVHVTDLTGCLRRAYFSKTVHAAQFPHEMLALSLGSITHGLLEGGDEIIRTEVPLRALGIVGKADVVYVDGFITDYKTTRWLTPSKLPYGSHVLQVNIYAQLLREQGEEPIGASIQYIDLSGPTKCRACKLPVIPVDGALECPICHARPRDAHLGGVLYPVDLKPADEIRHLIEERRDLLILALKSENQPDPEVGWLCGYCPFIEICEEGTEWKAQH